MPLGSFPLSFHEPTAVQALAHEINNMLQPAIGILEITLKQRADDQKLQRDLTVALESIRHIQTMVARLVNIKNEPSHSGDILKYFDDATMFARSVIPSSIIFEVNRPNINAYISMEEVEFLQVVMNLVVNAVNACNTLENQAIIKLQLLHHAHEIELQIHDNGGGIEADILAQVFEPFFTTRRHSGGTGLGLSLVKTMVEQVNGRVVLQSTPQKGTTASVFLPVENS